MSVLKGKKILLGISGGIAAYKTATLVRLFIKAGAHVQVIMTPASKDFVTPLTLSTLSKNPVYSTFFNQLFRIISKQLAAIPLTNFSSAIIILGGIY